MSLMRATDRAMNFRAHHSIARVAMLAEGARIQRASKTRPAGAGIKLVRATKQRHITTDTAIQPHLLVVVIRISERTLRALLTGHMILKVRQTGAPLLLAALDRIVPALQVNMRRQGTRRRTLAYIQIFISSHWNIGFVRHSS